jgi:hypothetical protein
VLGGFSVQKIVGFVVSAGMALILGNGLQAQSCALATISGSDRCENLSVQIDLRNCKDDAGKGGAGQVVCGRGAPRATYQTADFRYEFVLAEQSGGWGVKTWEVASSNRTALGTSRASTQSAAMTETAAPSALEQMPKVGAFLDFQYQYKKETKSPGFVLQDGALYISKESNNWGIFLDLPFAWGGDASNNNFKFATEKAQAYVTVSAPYGLGLSVGQFDTIFGFELNDTKDIAFTKPGIVFNAALPVTHTGALVTYTYEIEQFNQTRNLGAFTVKGLLSNPRNQGSTDGENLEFGGSLGFSNELVRFNLGYLAANFDGPVGTSQLFDFLAGFTYGTVNIDFEYDIKRYVGADKTTFGSTGHAVMAHIVAGITEELGLGVRGEIVSKMLNHHAVQLTFGPHYHFNENFTVRSDYTWNRTEASKGDDKVTAHEVNASLVAKF